MGHTVSVTTTQQSCCRVKAAKDQMYTHECVHTNVYIHTNVAVLKKKKKNKLFTERGVSGIWLLVHVC